MTNLFCGIIFDKSEVTWLICDSISPQAGYNKRTGHNEISQYVSKVTVMWSCDSHVASANLMGYATDRWKPVTQEYTGI